MRGPRWLARGAAAALLLALVVALPTVAAAQRSLVFEQLHADIVVGRNGDLTITETLRPRFTGEWNGILRRISLEPPKDYHADYLLGVRLLSATDGAGHALRTQTERISRTQRQFKVWVPDARDRAATVILTYRVRNALGFFRPEQGQDWQPMDELNWQVTGTEWEVPIQRASARVVFPGETEPRQMAAYVGTAGSQRRADIRATGPGTVDVAPVGPLRPGEGLTLAVGWPAGVVDRAAAEALPPLDGGWSFHPMALWPLLIPLLVLWWMAGAWNERGRDPEERAITVQWEPVEGLSPAEAGTLIDNDAGMRDIVSTLVDLAVRGYIVIEEHEKTGFLQFGRDYHFHLVRPRTEWDGLAVHEVRFLDALFETTTPAEVLAGVTSKTVGLRSLLANLGVQDASADAPPEALDTVRLSDLQNQFYKKIPPIKDAIYHQLVARGYYERRPDKVRGRYLGLAAVVAATSAGGFALSAYASGPFLVAAALASALIIGIFGWLMPRRTESGARAREASLGFKRFLERVEAPRYRRMVTSPDQFERFLPYAMAFQCEDRWAAAFDDLITEPPNWYRGTRTGFIAFHPSAFASDLGKLSSAASSTLSSSPGSSGSGGGGSVGGGGGGGGGGGF